NWWAPGLVTPLFLALSVVSVGLLVYFGFPALSNPKSGCPLGDGVPSGPPKSQDLFWALVGVLAVVSSLHLNPHDLTLLIFPGWILGAYAVSGALGKSQSRPAL